VLTLTAAGRRLLLRHAAEVAELEERMTSSLDSGDIEVFRSYLDACRVALTDPVTWPVDRRVTGLIELAGAGAEH
jgi:hypothetical protein